MDDPTVRPAMSGNAGDTTTQSRTQSRLITLSHPDVRLACCPIGEHGGGNSVRHYVEDCGLGQPTVRLAHVDGAQGDCVLKGEKGVAQLPIEMSPALLVSYYYLQPFLDNQTRYRYRDWVMDSGAFSAHNSGKTIELNAYIDKCLELIGKDKTLTEVFGLDVIGGADATLKNTEEMWRQGVPAIPTFHKGEPEEHLYHMAKEYPKIALGGVAMLRGDDKLAWLSQCFARVWPKKIHGFGMASEAIVYGLPFHSVDATNWEIAPCAFGNWMKFGSMSVRGSNQDLRSQVKHYLDLEAKARVRWKKEMEILDVLEPSPAKLGSPTVRLAADAAADAAAGGGLHLANAIGDSKNNPPEKTSKKAKLKKEVKAPATGLDAKWVDYWQNQKF